ncbi:MAG: FkbM family methyltransferase [Chromatiaceae bacterium]|nr:FkbM family methyltransferase [Chromatiaceae bacterium]MCP5315328.1 FkbM family methyltransferase [Chromatiaceae bacterium]
MFRKFKKLPKYLLTFGLLAGTRLFFQVEWHTKSGRGDRMRSLTVPGYANPIRLRDTVADHATFWQCIVMQQYDFSIFPQAENIALQYKATLAAGQKPLIIDCGANIGLSTIWLANRYPLATICSVEPDEANFSLLQSNSSHLKERSICLRGGIWPRPSKLTIINPEAGAAAFRVEELPVESDGGIRGYTIDEICTLAGNENPLYVKIDIEGAQAALFASNTEWVARTWLISLELDDWQFPWAGTSRTFLQTISRYPFDMLVRDESVFCFRNPND